ncbi:hypothetical protein PHMEG_00024404 [Phytophthora megakarya]|uniref:Uncharacterized protein n=1 Tax=Phytophthora megakarya TaxID=4795 RepID=A0A225VH30_9STRA|nr:hypothetical protein PHMEG_00024404 [Phytophthora megakarya]
MLLSVYEYQTFAMRTHIFVRKDMEMDTVIPAKLISSNRKYREEQTTANEICTSMSELSMGEYKSAEKALKCVVTLFGAKRFNELVRLPGDFGTLSIVKYNILIYRV